MKKNLKFKQNGPLFLFIGIFALISATLLIVIRAAGNNVWFEAEKGTRTGPANIVNDGNASDGQSIRFGSNAPPSTWGDHMGVSGGKPTRENVDRIVSLGVKWWKISWEQGWGNVDPGVTIDSIITYAKSKGLKVLQTCQKSPHTYSLNDVNTFPAYCASYVDKGVNAIEIGNEWNHSPFWNNITVNGNYSLQAAISDATTAAIRAKSATIPIMNSGWSPKYVDSLGRGYPLDTPHVAMARFLDSSDGRFKNNATNIAHHPYSYTCRVPFIPSFPDQVVCEYPANKTGNAVLQTQDIYNAAVARGFNKKIWFTELGGPSAGFMEEGFQNNYTTQVQRDQYQAYMDGVRYLRDKGVPVDLMFWHSIRDGESATNDLELSFGLFDRNWVLKPAGQLVRSQATKPW